MRITTQKNIKKFARLGLLVTLALAGCRGATEKAGEPSSDLGHGSTVPQVAAHAGGLDCQVVGNAGDTVLCPLELTGSNEAVAAQFSLTVPENVSITGVVVNGQETNTLPTGHTVQHGEIKDGAAIFLLFNPTSLDRLDIGGEILSVALTLDKTFSAKDDAKATFKNFVVSNKSGKAISTSFGQRSLILK